MSRAQRGPEGRSGRSGVALGRTAAALGGFWPGLNLRSNPRRDSGVDLPPAMGRPAGVSGPEPWLVVVEHAHGPSDRHVLRWV